MLIIRIPKRDTDFIYKVAAKFRRNIRQGLVLGDIAYSDTAMYLMVPDEALSVAFAYSVYLEAKGRGLRVEPMYATSVDLDRALPGSIKKVGGSWLRRKPPKGEIESLKNRLVTPNILEVLMG